MSSKFEKVANYFDTESFLDLNKTISIQEYVDKIYEKPTLVRTSFQYIFDMILSKGTSTFERQRKTYVDYHFFDDKEIPIIGLKESTITELMNFIRAAAFRYGTEKRILLLHGPVGSAKSTICRLLKKGLEEYSRTNDGTWYTFEWYDLPIGSEGIYTHKVQISPMNENPIKLMPMEMRNRVLKDLNDSRLEGLSEEDKLNIYPLYSEGDLNPLDRLFLNSLLKKYNGSWEDVMKNHIRVVRRVHSEIDRCGIGTFQPKDEKNQDSTELTGDLNYQKIAKYGSDSDARAFNFDGEFNIANRGMLEFIECLKLDSQFLYDLLGATQEHKIKPKKFSLVDIDEMIIGHTNTPEFEKMRDNKFMEALKDRTYKVDVPYVIRISDELEILEKDFNSEKVKQHIMPHSLYIAALFGVLTRLKEDNESNISLVDKAKLYNGEQMPKFTEDNIKEMQDRYPDEGMKYGLSVRFIQDCISACLAKHPTYVNVFHIMNEIKERLHNTVLINDKTLIKLYEERAEEAIKELNEILKSEVQEALVADENSIVRLFNQYIDNLMAYVDEKKVINKITGKAEPHNEKLMRSIEEKIGITDKGVDQFRTQIAKFIASLSHSKQEFKWDSNIELKKALKAKVFEDVKDHIKLSCLSSEVAVVDKELTEKIDAIKTRLKRLGYNDQSATDVLDYVSSIYSSGDLTEG